MAQLLHFWSLQIVLRRNAAWLAAEEDKPGELIALAIAADQFQSFTQQDDDAA